MGYFNLKVRLEIIKIYFKVFLSDIKANISTDR